LSLRVEGLKVPQKSDGNKELQFQVYNSFAKLPAEFISLFENATNESVFFAREWFLRSVEHFLQQSQDLRIFAAKKDNVPSALLIVFEKSLLENAAWVNRKILSSCTTSQSFRSSLICAKESDVSDILIGLVEYLEDSKYLFHKLDLELLSFSQDDRDKWAQKLTESKCHFSITLQEWNRYEDVKGVPFSKLAKKSTKRREKKLARTSKIDFQLYQKPDEIQEAINAYENIYQRTWKDVDVGKKFASDLIHDYASRGWVKFLIMSVDGLPVAAECFFVHHRKACSFRTAYDLKYRDYGVGSIVLQKMFQILIKDDLIDEIDFGPGDEDYKKQWLTKTRPLWRLQIFSSSSKLSRSHHFICQVRDEFLTLADGPVGKQLRKTKHSLIKTSKNLKERLNI